MKNRVNLYLEEYRPTLDLLSLGTLITVFTLLFLVVVAARIGLSVAGGQDAKNLERVSAEVTRSSNLAKELTNALQARKEDPQLLAIFAGLQASLEAKERLKQALGEREVMKSAGFSVLLQELAQHHHQELWLTRINVAGNNMVLDGQALTPTALPQWLGKLGQGDYFSGREFDQAQLLREERGLLFSLSTERSGQRRNGNAGGQN